MAASDEMAYREFYAMYAGRLRRYLLVLAAGDEERAREALQATLMRVVRHIRVFADEAVFWSWLTCLARSASVDHGRKHRRYLAFLDRFSQHVGTDAADLADDSADQYLHECRAAGLAALPAEERQLIAWKYQGRRSVREIAAELGTTEKAVESKLTRLRAKLKEAVLAALKHET
ncbi:MAG TPA: sigma-70 family RNA polymerase sigma factor [Opitutus sp.]|nr:sigma-70 family RNA polymerase sigma factor [Opitutus sp.]